MVAVYGDGRSEIRVLLAERIYGLVQFVSGIRLLEVRETSPNDVEARIRTEVTVPDGLQIALDEPVVP